MPVNSFHEVSQMSNITEWKIQLAWSASSVFATGSAWYFLSLKIYKLFYVSMILAIVFAGIAIYLHKKKDSAVPLDQPLQVTTNPAQDFIQRYIDEPSEIRFINALPKMRTVYYKICQEGWDTGVTVEMNKASYELIDFLESSWIRLAEYYPPRHFGGTDPKSYISKYIQERFAFHRAKYEPEGPGTGGTMVGIRTGGDVISDLETEISDLVTALFSDINGFDINIWLKEWRHKPK